MKCGDDVSEGANTRTIIYFHFLQLSFNLFCLYNELYLYLELTSLNDQCAYLKQIITNLTWVPQFHLFFQ
jgi:hypothetical protein